MNKRIKYFCYYGDKDATHSRDSSPAADTKIDYIIAALNNCSYGVDIISSATNESLQLSSSYSKIEQNNTYKFFLCIGKSKYGVLNLLDRVVRNIQLFIWCITHLKRNEQVMIYHSLGYVNVFIILSKLLRIRIIGDVEEIYQDVHDFSNFTKRNEFRFFKLCDKFMFPNTVLNDRINSKGIPSVVCHGIYRNAVLKYSKFTDGLIHVLYSGTFDPVKGGAVAAVKSCKYLDERYHLHITGFGDKSQVCAEIEAIRNETKASISFHGYLDTAQFVELLQRCHIGLCTQDPTSRLNLTSFPSKILNYLSNGLVVLSGINDAITKSAVGDILFYYQEQTPKSISEGILKIGFPDYKVGRDRLEKLDIDFKSNLGTFLDR